MCLACSVLCNGCSHVPIHTFLLALNHICCEAYPADPPPTPGPVALLNVLRCVNPDGLQTAAHQGGEQPRSGYVGVFVLRPKAQDSSAASWRCSLGSRPFRSPARLSRTPQLFFLRQRLPRPSARIRRCSPPGRFHQRSANRAHRTAVAAGEFLDWPGPGHTR